MRTIQLYAAGSATANAVASVIIPTAGRIKAVQVGLGIDTVTDNGFVRLELSKSATAQITTNGALDAFFLLAAYNNLLTSGLFQGAVNSFFPLDVPVRQGELIYIHANVSGTAQYYFNGILWYS